MSICMLDGVSCLIFFFKSVVRMGKTALVDQTELRWKPVQVPDTLDDFNGFYGLEEIDGVGVKIVNGEVKFLAKEDSKVFKQSEEDEEEEEEEEEEELIEFKNLDDIADGELSAASSSSEENEGEEDGEDDDDKEGDDDSLAQNVFTAGMALNGDIAPVELPEWSQIAPSLSFTTLHGLSQLGFSSPTEIQKSSIPMALKGEDIMGKASTGSGKTLAYGIPILEKLIASDDGASPIALIFTPTRELAQQVTKHLQKIASLLVEKNPYTILSLTGGLSIQKQERLLKYDKSGRIVIATPGRFLELIEKNSDLLKRFAQIDTLVLDEADRLLQDGHFDEFTKILKILGQKRASKNGWQTMIFSATFSIDLFDKLSNTSWKSSKKLNPDQDNEMEIVLKHLMRKIHFKSKPIIIDTNPEHKISSQVKESLIECAATERDLYVYYFITMYPGTTLIFCNAIESVKKLHCLLNNLNIPTYQIHSSMIQKNRLKNLEKYQQQSEKNEKLGKSTVLIASDVAARGLDIPNIQHVIHYHLPRTADVYIHRSGRTARAQKEGVSIMICSPEEAIGPLRKLRRMLANNKGPKSKRKWQKDVPLLPIEMDIVAQLKERSRLANELANHKLASRSLQKDENWMKKAADDLGIELDSDDERRDVHLAKTKNKKLNKTLGKDQVKVLEKQLNELLMQPIRKDRRQRYLTGGLVNLADNLIKKRGHNQIIGHEKTEALKLLKKKKKVDKK